MREALLSIVCIACLVGLMVFVGLFITEIATLLPAMLLAGGAAFCAGLLGNEVLVG
jgi:hypothetical protein